MSNRSINHNCAEFPEVLITVSRCTAKSAGIAGRRVKLVAAKVGKATATQLGFTAFDCNALRNSWVAYSFNKQVKLIYPFLKKELFFFKIISTI